MIQFGFDSDRGFIAVDTDRRVASYAYYSSLHQDAAAHASRAERIEQIAIEMLRGESEWMHRLNPSFYDRMASKLKSA